MLTITNFCDCTARFESIKLTVHGSSHHSAKLLLEGIRLLVDRFLLSLQLVQLALDVVDLFHLQEESFFLEF